MTTQQVLLDSILFITLIIAVITDLKSRKIYDKLTIPVSIIGITLNTVFYQLDGLKNSAIGWVLGVFIFMLFGFGGGDLKLMGAIGTLKGWMFTLTSAVYIAIIGGVLTILYLLWTGQLLKILTSMFHMVFKRTEFKKEPNKLYLPYGPMILLGILWNYLSDFFDVLKFIKF